jgi:hypothetical protein
MNEITKLKPLTGHTSPETAYVVNDYPYGFRLRCKIRYWLEFKKNQGFRLVSQTTNPKVAREVWNKPKASTYSHLAIMGLDEKNHVTWTGFSFYGGREELDAFHAEYGAFLDADQKAVYEAIVAAYERQEKRKALAAAAAAANNPTAGGNA